MRCIRANHDAKLIMNGAETCVLVLYTTNYAIKKQNRSSNASALIAKRLAFHQAEQSGDESLTSLAVYFRNWHMFSEYMNNIPC